MKIGIILGVILGIILLIIGGVISLAGKLCGKKCKWCVWVTLAGVCALLTAAANALRFLA